MLGDITAANEIYIVCGYTDMRRSIDGLCAIVQDRLRMEPRRRALYLFCGKRCDRIKCLLWENDGYDMDKNVITHIETNKRYVTDIELRALLQVLGVSYACLIDGTEK